MPEMGRAYIQKNMYQDAIEIFNRLRQGGNSQGVAHLVIAYAAAGRESEARTLLAQVLSHREWYVPPYWIAVAYLRLGEKDAAFRWLDKAHQENDPTLGNMKVDPMLDPLRSDPRYSDLLRKADLSD